MKVVGGPGDGGVDVVAMSDKENILIQTKHTQKGHFQHTEGIKEVRGAHSNYEERHKCKFKLLVATNGKFSESAIQLSVSGTPVELIDGRSLSRLLTDHAINLADVEAIKSHGKLRW